MPLLTLVTGGLWLDGELREDHPNRRSPWGPPAPPGEMGHPHLWGEVPSGAPESLPHSNIPRLPS